MSLLVKSVLGGGAAWITGQAVARTWGPLWQLAVYVALLAVAVGLLGLALTGPESASILVWSRDALILGVVAFLGYRVARAERMAAQYPWLFERAGPLSWRPRRE